MEKITAYSVLNRDYTDKLRNRLVLKPGSTQRLLQIFLQLLTQSYYYLFMDYLIIIESLLLT